MNEKKEIITQMRKFLHEIAGEVGIVMAYVNSTFELKLSGEHKELGECSVSSLYKIRDEINKMRNYVEEIGISDQEEKK